MKTLKCQERWDKQNTNNATKMSSKNFLTSNNCLKDYSSMAKIARKIAAVLEIRKKDRP